MVFHDNFLFTPGKSWRNLFRWTLCAKLFRLGAMGSFHAHFLGFWLLLVVVVVDGFHTGRYLVRRYAAVFLHKGFDRCDSPLRHYSR